MKKGIGQIIVSHVRASFVPAILVSACLVTYCAMPMAAYGANSVTAAELLGSDTAAVETVSATTINETVSASQTAAADALASSAVITTAELDAATEKPAFRVAAEMFQPKSSSKTDQVTIADENVPLAAFDNDAASCNIHWMLLGGMFLTVAYGFIVCFRRAHFIADANVQEEELSSMAHASTIMYQPATYSYAAQSAF